LNARLEDAASDSPNPDHQRHPLGNFLSLSLCSIIGLEGCKCHHHCSYDSINPFGLWLPTRKKHVTHHQGLRRPWTFKTKPNRRRNQCWYDLVTPEPRILLDTLFSSSLQFTIPSIWQQKRLAQSKASFIMPTTASPCQPPIAKNAEDAISEESSVKQCIQANGVALVELNRPQKRKALSQRMIDELVSTLRNLDNNSGVRTVVLTGCPNGPFSGKSNWVK
jgi:hypothetical protein